MEEEKGIKDNVEEVKENLQAGPSLTAGAEPREEGSMVLRTEDLVKKYGKRTVVSHVSIDVKQGEIVGLLGPNGAGKTTSFYMTVGLITPNEGRIFLNDLDITKYPVYKRAQTGRNIAKPIISLSPHQVSFRQAEYILICKAASRSFSFITCSATISGMPAASLSRRTVRL